MCFFFGDVVGGVGCVIVGVGVLTVLFCAVVVLSMCLILVLACVLLLVMFVLFFFCVCGVGVVGVAVCCVAIVGGDGRTVNDAGNAGVCYGDDVVGVAVVVCCVIRVVVGVADVVVDGVFCCGWCRCL